jgi:hypothetical protein
VSSFRANCLVKTVQKSLFLCVNFIILSDITFSRRLKVLVDGYGINKWITWWFPGVYAIFRFAQYQDSRLVILSKQQSAWARLERKCPLSTCPRVAASQLPLPTVQANFQFLLTIIWKREFAGQSSERTNLREQIKACLLNAISERRLRFVKERISGTVHESSEFHVIYPSSKLVSACKCVWIMHSYVGLFMYVCSYVCLSVSDNLVLVLASTVIIELWPSGTHYPYFSVPRV